MERKHITLTQEQVDRIKKKAEGHECDLVHIWSDGALTFGRSNSLFRTASYTSHYDGHDWIKVDELEADKSYEL